MEIEDGCLGGFLSFAELERYFIHGKYKCMVADCIALSNLTIY